ncbi:MAG: hypothetical protein R3F20_16000 [Planctomycetota bacterium]
MKHPRSRLLVAPAFILLSFGLVACGGGGGGSAVGATTSPLLTAEVMQPAFDGRVFGSTVLIRVRTQAPEAAVRINGFFAIPDASKTTWTSSLPAAPGPLDIDVEILAANGSVREKGIARRIEVHETDVRKLEWYEPDETHSRLRALARRRDDSLVFVEYDLVAGGMKIVRTDAGQEISLGTAVAPFTWATLRDVVYDVQNEVQGAPIDVRRIEVATGAISAVAVTELPGDAINFVPSLRYDRLGDSLLLQAGGTIGGNFGPVFRRYPGGMSPPIELPFPPMASGGSIGVPALSGGPITLTVSSLASSYFVVDPILDTVAAATPVFVPGAGSNVWNPVQPDFAIPGAILNVRQFGLFVDQPSAGTSTQVAAFTPLNSSLPIYASQSDGAVIVPTGKGPLRIDRLDGSAARVPTVGQGTFPDFISPPFVSGFRLENELVGIYPDPVVTSEFRVTRHDLETSATTEIPVTGIDFPDGVLLQGYIGLQSWDSDAGRLIAVLSTFEAFSVVSIDLISVDIDTGEAIVLASSDVTGPSGSPVRLLHDRARGRYLLVTGTGGIYGYDVAGILGLVAQLPSPSPSFPTPLPATRPPSTRRRTAPTSSSPRTSERRPSSPR